MSGDLRERKTAQGNRNAAAPGSTARMAEDDLADERLRQAAGLEREMAESGVQQLYNEFRRKVACGESVSSAAGKLAAALRFSGRITLTFHQGRITKTVLEESYFRSGGRT